MSDEAERPVRDPAERPAPVLLPVHDELPVRWSADGLPRNYGDASAEYRAARDAAVVVDRGDRALVRMHGRDPLRILQGVLTNDVAGAPAGRAVYAALLTPKGRMVSELRVMREDAHAVREDAHAVREGADFLLEVPAAALPALLETFRRTVPPLFARFQDVSGERHVLGVYGPQATSHLASLVGPPPPAADEDAHALLEYGGAPVHVVASGYAGITGYELIADRDVAVALWRALLERGVAPMGHAALDVLRIEAGRPRWGAELTETTIPLEAGLERAISTGKGCYTGQEVIIRILHRGHVNWHLRGVLLGGAPSPAHDTPLLDRASGKKVGRITSSAWSPRHDQEIALAYVRREVVPPAELALGAVDGPSAAVVALPFPA